MGLSGLESAEPIETKAVARAGLGSSGMFSSPGCSRIVPAALTTRTSTGVYGDACVDNLEYAMDTYFFQIWGAVRSKG
jgi:hypothetical protein